MLALTVFLFLLFGYVEVRRALLEPMPRPDVAPAADDAAPARPEWIYGDAAPRLLVPFHTPAVDSDAAERARRAYAVRCSCDGRDS